MGHLKLVIINSEWVQSACCLGSWWWRVGIFGLTRVGVLIKGEEGRELRRCTGSNYNVGAWNGGERRQKRCRDSEKVVGSMLCRFLWGRRVVGLQRGWARMIWDAWHYDIVILTLHIFLWISSDYDFKEVFLLPNFKKMKIIVNK